MASLTIPERVDVAVVGAGLGGLLAAAGAANRGRSVLVLERLPYPGGRYTTVPQEGYEVTTGALHLAPHGSGGPLAHLLRDVGASVEMVKRDITASFVTDDRHITWSRPWHLWPLLGPRGATDAAASVVRLHLGRERDPERDFADWLDQHVSDRTVRRMYDRFVEFALSVTSSDVTFVEVRAFFRRLARCGFPQAPVGGAKAVIDGLVGRIEELGGIVATDLEVEGLSLPSSDGPGLVTARSRTSDEAVTVAVGRSVVSDAGPVATSRLLAEDLPHPEQASPAGGLKLHVVSDRSMIPHNGIVFCLDTERISGMVEVSRLVPGSTPPGMHMIDTFQVLHGDTVAEAKQHAIGDMRRVFGPDYDRHCRVLRASAFRARWPVNHARQGLDVREPEPRPNLLMVGDAYKPEGSIMIDGVADSVRAVTDRL